MQTDKQEFAVGDAVLVVGTDHDGKVGTILKVKGNGRYLVALEDGTEVALSAGDLSLRR